MRHLHGRRARRHHERRAGLRRAGGVAALAAVLGPGLLAGLSDDDPAGITTYPDWSAAANGLVVPSMPLDRDGLLAVTAMVGTTLAPWGLAFIGSYAADKRIDVSELRYERIDVVTGAVMTGVIGAFVVVACAATLHAGGRSIDDARDAATALEPLAGSLAAALFGVGLLGAALLAASVVPLSTAYSVSEAAGRPGRLDDSCRKAPVFYGTYAGVTIVAAGLVLVPGAPLIDILYLTQALNAIVLVPLLWAIRTLARPLAHGRARAGRGRRRRRARGFRRAHGVRDRAGMAHSTLISNAAAAPCPPSAPS